MKKYYIFFHYSFDDLEDMDYDEKAKDYRGNKTTIWSEEEFSFFLNPNIKFNFVESYPKKVKRNDPVQCHTFACLLGFDAKDDKSAINKVGKVLKDNDVDWVDIYILIDSNERIIKEVI